ncbi:MAG: peptide chain release factor N(5)-glutamine methyltransferase [Jatrophihabitans sp.]|nr:MAG: peptide chain release factor N(5)-glutamine methyltransferase [Jatrophihabitans sp.]
MLRGATARLAAAGVPSPRVDAELLLCSVLGTTRTRLLASGPVGAADADRFREAVRRRERREPLQHIVGTAPFRHVELAVGPGVFVPRPETELLVDVVLALLPAPAVVVDLCAGSGALALAMAGELPAARVFAVERSASALGWLRRNTAGAAVTVVPGDVGDTALLAELAGGVDVVVANPPYVPDGTPVPAEVLADPPEAVFAGPDGLAVIPHVLARAGDLLRAGGALALEHDVSHRDALARLLARDGRWSAPREHADLTGRPRFTTARRA